MKKYQYQLHIIVDEKHAWDEKLAAEITAFLTGHIEEYGHGEKEKEEYWKEENHNFNIQYHTDETESFFPYDLKYCKVLIYFDGFLTDTEKDILKRRILKLREKEIVIIKDIESFEKVVELKKCGGGGIFKWVCKIEVRVKN